MASSFLSTCLEPAFLFFCLGYIENDLGLIASLRTKWVTMYIHLGNLRVSISGPTGKTLIKKHTHLRSQESTRVHISYLSNGLISFRNEQLTAPSATPNVLFPPPRIPCPLLLLACSIPAENKVQMRWVRAISTSWKYVLFDSTGQVVRPWIRKARLDHALTVDIVI